MMLRNRAPGRRAATLPQISLPPHARMLAHFAISGPDETWKENSESGRLRGALAAGCPQTSAA